MDVQQLRTGLSASREGANAGPAADALARALALHDQGRLDDAKQLYDAILAATPDHAEALHLSGVVQFQRGKPSDAEALMQRSVSLAPAPLPLANLGSVLVSLGRREEALRHFDAALAIDPRHLHAMVRRGNTLLELTRYEEALATYDRALTVMPTLFDALCNRGSALRALGRFQEALDTYDRALAVQSNSVEALANRGNALRDLARFEEALRSYEGALAITPDNVQLMSLRGRTLVDLGRFQEALASFNEAIASRPDFIEALYNSAVALERLGRPEQAIDRCNRVLTLEPGHARALATRGTGLLRLGRYDAALSDYDRVLEIDPSAHDVLSNRGTLLRQIGRYEEALANYDEACATGAALPEVWANRGNVLQDLHRYEEALDAYGRALAIDSQYAHGWFNRGNVLQLVGRPDEALESYDRAVSANPHHFDAHFAKSFVYLRDGDFARGWEQYEWRRQAMAQGRELRDFAHPRWTGVQPLEGKTILLHAEQGFGDTIQFCRYAAPVRARGANVIIEVPPALKALVASMDAGLQVVATGEPLPPFDLHCPLLSLPLAFRDDLHSIPDPTPYLYPNTELVSQWKALLGDRHRPRIGLAWSGNPDHRNDRNRSIALTMFEPLFDMNVEWVSLQKVVREEDEATVAASPLRDVREQIRDFADTAALMHTLDLVIAVDTSVAHLAGAMNLPVWILLPHFAEWRWMREGETSPWYRSARLFRQDSPGDWPRVIEAIRQTLAGL